MSRLTAIDRANADVAAGRAWKARDRLQGARSTMPHDQELLGLLGDVAWAMGDLPAAGAAWWLTDRSGPHVDAAFLALSERAGGDPMQLLRMIKPEPPVTRYPAPAVARVEQLVRNAQPWDRYQWLFNEKPARAAAHEETWEWSWRDGLADATVSVAMFAPWFIGVGAIAARVLRLGRRRR